VWGPATEAFYAISVPTTTPSQLKISSLKYGDVLVFDRGIIKVLVAIRGSRCLPLYPSSAFLSATTEKTVAAAWKSLFAPANDNALAMAVA